MGARAYSIIEQFDDFRPGECVVEIGSERGEGSTEWLAAFCARRRVQFHTVDLNPEVYAGAYRIVSRYDSCHAHLAAGEEFLANGLLGPIRFAYLDSFDCIPTGLEQEPFVEFYRQQYLKLGMEMTNENSSAAHLAQATLVATHAASRCAILIDDTFPTESAWEGKGALALPYLHAHGFEVRDLGGAQLAVRETP